jgi:type I restriction enzyme S subunit
LIKKGDFVINSRSDRKGSSGLSSLDGSCSSIYIVLEPKGIDGKFAHELLRSQVFQEEFYRWGTGIVDDLWSTRYARMKMISIPVPPENETQGIISYLDQETSKIDLLISKKEQLIEKLLERRQALITQVVTKGLDPSVPMKDSGIEWVGMVPEHWKLGRLKRFVEFGSGSAFPEDYQGDLTNDIPFLKVDDLGKNRNYEVVSWQHTISKQTASSLKARIHPKGSLLMAKIGAALLLRRVKKLVTPSCIDNNLIAINAGPKLEDSYLANILASLDFAHFVNPGTVPSTSGSAIGSNTIPLPPLSEQIAITTFLSSELIEIESLVDKSQKSIQLLSERRQALITQVVTGKLDVRGLTDGDS